MVLSFLCSCSSEEPPPSDSRNPIGINDPDSADQEVPQDTAQTELPEHEPGSKKKLRYLALGDSYTIGQGVKENERWPVQLVEKLKRDSLIFEEPRIIAVTGWTTTSLISAIKSQSPDSLYDMVSLLIGVNNQYQGRDIEVFKEEFEYLLKQSISLAGGEKNRVFVVSIPDYGVTPFAASGDRNKIAREIDAYNKIKKSICGKYDVSFYNITDISRKAGDDPTLLASDRLHPSGKMYSLWIERFGVEVAKQVKGY